MICRGRMSSVLKTDCSPLFSFVLGPEGGRLLKRIWKDKLIQFPCGLDWIIRTSSPQMWSSFLYVYTLNCTDTSYCNSQSFRSNTRRNLFSVHRSLVASKKEDLKWAGSQDTCNTSKFGPETVDVGRKAGRKIHILKTSQLWVTWHWICNVIFHGSWSISCNQNHLIWGKPDCLKIWLGKNLGLPCARARSCSRSRHFLQR